MSMGAATPLDANSDTNVAEVKITGAHYRREIDTVVLNSATDVEQLTFELVADNRSTGSCSISGTALPTT